MSTATRLIPAEEYARMPEADRPTELVRGEIVEKNVPPPRLGLICGKDVSLSGNFVHEHTPELQGREGTSFVRLNRTHWFPMESISV